MKMFSKFVIVIAMISSTSAFAAWEDLGHQFDVADQAGQVKSVSNGNQPESLLLKKIERIAGSKYAGDRECPPRGDGDQVCYLKMENGKTCRVYLDPDKNVLHGVKCLFTANDELPQ